MKFIKSIILIIITCIISYLVFAFIMFEINPDNWTGETRFGALVFILIENIFIMFLLTYSEEKK